ncbi:MAG: translation initiation factor IF-3 [Actinomycetota bacterium]
MNDRIRSPQVRLVGADGSQIGIVSTQEALRQAQELDLDLVEVAPQANPPVARIMDYGKFKYERDIRQKEARKKQVRVEVKEIKFRPKIDRHDYATKKGHVVRFLSAGARVKVTIMFRGREMAHTDLGRKILDRLVEDLGDTAVVEAQPKQDGRNMVMVIGPTKKAAEQRTEASKPGPRSEAEASPEPVEEPSGPDAVEPAGAEEQPADAVEEAPRAEEQPQAPGSVEGPQPATR